MVICTLGVAFIENYGKAIYEHMWIDDLKFSITILEVATKFWQIVECLMADRPMASISRAGRPRTRSRSVHLPSCIPVAPKAVKPRTKSGQRTQVKGKGKGAGKG